jgi:hypothetical protein
MGNFLFRRLLIGGFRLAICASRSCSWVRTTNSTQTATHEWQAVPCWVVTNEMASAPQKWHLATELLKCGLRESGKIGNTVLCADIFFFLGKNRIPRGQSSRGCEPPGTWNLPGGKGPSKAGLYSLSSPFLDPRSGRVLAG